MPLKAQCGRNGVAYHEAPRRDEQVLNSFTPNTLPQFARGQGLYGADQPVVFDVGSDPEPHDVLLMLQGKRPVMNADAGGPETADLLEMERGVMRIFS